jgi:hypothetical protein
MDIKERCYQLREKLKAIGEEVRGLHGDECFDVPQGTALGEPAQGEMRANITLTYRHLEDARMRLGKVVQAYDGGASCYPR